MRTEAEVCESFKVALLDLTFNSKPMITGLTVRARESIAFAPSIVKTIEEHFINTSLATKLPCLYLIDSIVKNLGAPFVELFAERLSDTFCAVYTSLVDEKTRHEFLRVYGLWYGVFPELPLRDIEERLRLRQSRSKRLNREPLPPLPRAHPPPPPPAPLQATAMFPREAFEAHYPPPPPPPPHPLHHPLRPVYHLPHSTAPPMARHLQTAPPRLSPPVFGLLAQLQTVLMTPYASPPHAIHDIMYRLGALGELEPMLFLDLEARCRSPDPRPALDLLGRILESPGGQYDQRSAFQTEAAKPKHPPVHAEPHAKDPPAAAHHHAIYADRPKQCRVCGIRFADNPADRDAYALHLDAHFRRNMRLKDSTKKVLARDWLQPAADWAAGKAPGASEKHVPVFFDSLLKDLKEASKTPSSKDAGSGENGPAGHRIKAGESDRDRRCPLCNEPLDMVFDNDQDEWMFEGAVERDGEIYHNACTHASAESDHDSAAPANKKSRQ